MDDYSNETFLSDTKVVCSPHFSPHVRSSTTITRKEIKIQQNKSAARQKREEQGCIEERCYTHSKKYKKIKQNAKCDTGKHKKSIKPRQEKDLCQVKQLSTFVIKHLKPFGFKMIKHPNENIFQFRTTYSGCSVWLTLLIKQKQFLIRASHLKSPCCRSDSFRSINELDKIKSLIESLCEKTLDDNKNKEWAEQWLEQIKLNKENT